MLKRLFVIFRSPILIQLNANTMYERNWEMTKPHIVSRICVPHSMRLIALEDGSFLLFDKYKNLLIRLNESLENGSGPMSRFYYLLDAARFREAITRSAPYRRLLDRGIVDDPEKPDWISDQQVSDIIEEYIHMQTGGD